MTFSPPVVGTRFFSPASRWANRPGFIAIASFTDDWWSIEIPQLAGVFAHASAPAEVENAARDAISLALSVHPESFEVRTIFVEPPEQP